MLQQRAEEASQGQPRVVLVEGEAGFGKSALLCRFLSGLDRACVLRASGEESEAALAYGVIGQLLTSAAQAGAAQAGAAPAGAAPARGALAAVGAGLVPPQADPLTAGADLAGLLGQVQGGGRLAVVAVDDLHWADGRSAAALLFALRHMQADRVLGVVTARPGEIARLGEAWSRFLSGDYRASRIRLAGLGVSEIVALGRTLATAEISYRAAARVHEHTGGSPLYCRALLEETDPHRWGEWEQGLDGLPTPPALAGMLLARLRGLSGPAQAMAGAAAVLGRSASLCLAASLGGLSDPVPALDEAVRIGLVRQEQHLEGTRVVFSHPLIRRAVYDSLGPAERRRLHQQAAGLVAAEDALGHRFAAAAGHEAGLAADLAAAGHAAAGSGRLARAAVWLAQAAAVSPDVAHRETLLLDALEAAVRCGDAGAAEALAPRVTQLRPGARRSMLLGHLDLLAGRVESAVARLTQAWQGHDPTAEPLVGARAALQLAFCSVLSGGLAEAARWGERAVAAAAGDETLRRHALGALAVVTASAHGGTRALATLDFLAAAPADVPLALTDVLADRGAVRAMTEDLTGAAADLSAAAARLRSGTPLRDPGQCLGYLAETEFQLGDWNDAALHGELAVSLCRDCGRRQDLVFAHAFAALVPAARGDADVAAAHVAKAGAAARVSGAAMAVSAWATARAAAAAARSDHDEVLRAAADVRAAGRDQFLGGLSRHGWRPLEVGALISTGDLGRAAKSLARLRASLGGAGPPSLQLAADRLRGSLAAERGDAGEAELAFASAWRRARGLTLPFHLGLLETADGRRLRQAGRRPEAIARLRSARARLSALGARPYVAGCDAELLSCGIQVRGEGVPETLGLTPGELAVARLVATGRSNREVAAELYVSVKAIEFHLGNVFTKLGIHSRRALAARLGGPPPEWPAGQDGGVMRTAGAPNARQ